MLYIYMADPDKGSFADYQKLLKPEDTLILTGAGVKLFLKPEYTEFLENFTELYASESDLLTYGIAQWYGQEIKVDKMVSMIAKLGSPMIWKD